MEDYRVAARMVRWTARNAVHNLGLIPEEKLDWNPVPEAKCARAIVGEMIAVMRMMLPVFEGGDWQPIEFPRPASVDEAKTLLYEAADQYALALEAAGPALERPIVVGGAPMWGTGVVLFPVVDLIHHHGQLAYIQSLLGDKESHFDMEASVRWFGLPTGPAAESS